MSCTRRGFLKTIGAAMVGLGVTRLDGFRAFAARSTAGPMDSPILGTEAHVRSLVGLPTLATGKIETLQAAI